jgi:L-threonylcarbamoyladenylate synthase
MTMFDSLADTGLLQLLQNGAVGVLPTDTIYGIAAPARNKQAVARLYAIKHREGKPGTLVAASIEQLVQLGIAREHLDAVARLWPNPVSIVLPAGIELSYLHQGKDSLAVRIPKDEALRALLEQTGPLITSSANQPGDPPADTIGQAQACFGEEVDFYVDGGNVSGRSPSTVARLQPDGTLEVLRQGAVQIN